MSMSSTEAPFHYPDPEAHEPGCLKSKANADLSSPADSFDIFCDCHRYTEPRILANGIDIAWPAGWDEQQALEWRNKHRVIDPSKL